MPDYESPSKWTPALVHQSIDPILLNDRRIIISDEMREAIRLDKCLASAEEQRRGNSGYYPHEWVRLEIRRTDEWADKLVKAWLEIWESQHRPQCPALFRAIFEWELQPLFAVRRSCFQAESERLETVKKQAGRFTAACGLLAREMGKLASKWNRKLDVANREAMYRGIRSRQSAPAHSLPPSSPGIPLQPESKVAAASANASPKRRFNYRSEVKRAIQLELTRKPDATDLEVCRAFDIVGFPDLPKNWQPKPGDREFEAAYMGDRTRPLVEKAISKVRVEMRSAGLLPPK